MRIGYSTKEWDTKTLAILSKSAISDMPKISKSSNTFYKNNANMGSKQEYVSRQSNILHLNRWNSSILNYVGQP